MKDTLKYGFTLGIICFIAGTLLALVNSVAEPKIRAQEASEEEAALKEVFPGVDLFKPHAENGKIGYYSAYDHSGKLKGFVIKAEGKGYASTIVTLTSLDLNLDIMDIKVLSQNETPGFGTRVEEPSFLSQFKGKDMTAFNKIDTITGATISSKALINSVKDKIEGLKDKMNQEIKIGK